jgi:hypothetical protein
MTTPVAELVEQYFAIWNDRDEASRRATITTIMTEDSTYSDPDYAGVHGHTALSAAVATAQEKFGTLEFSLGEIIGVHHDVALFTWRLAEPGAATPVAVGHDFAELEDGRIRRVVGFF